MVENNILEHYRAGIRGFLLSQDDEEIRTTVPEFQSIILEEALSCAKNEIIGVYNCAKRNLWTQDATKIVTEKISQASGHIVARLVYVPSGDGYIGAIGNLREAAIQVPNGVLQNEGLTTFIVVDGKITLAVGDKDDKPLLLFPRGLDGFTAQAVTFASNLWTFTTERLDSNDMERSHE